VKVIWLVPPTHKGKYPNIGQYRFYKNMPVRASIEYPYLNAMGVTQLHEAGHDVKFYDCPTMNLSWDKIQPALESAQLIIMEARTPIVKYIYEVSEMLRSSFNANVALYGDHVTCYPQEALQHCDYVISGGDYDYGARALADMLSSYGTRKERKEASRIFRAGLVENLDSLPFVDRKLVPHEIYFEAWKIRKVYLYTMSGRGCWFNCSFCAWNTPFWENRVRQRSIHDVVQEFWEAYWDYGKCYIWDDHDCFDTAWGVKFARELLRTGNKNKEILWAFQTHSNMIHDLEALKTMKKAGLHLVKLGIESGNQKTLDIIRKGTTVEQHEKAIRLLKEADINVHANLMVGFPWETKEEAYHTIDWIKKQDPNQAQFSLAIPYPWTELYEIADEKGWLLVREGDWESYDATHPMMSMKGMSSEEIVKLYKDCWAQFYLNWHYKLKHLSTVRNLADLKQLLRGYYSVRFGHMKSIERAD
jgi:anaerobic magnesium-protoporphyrin IX monomethyl ester cyclase